jgi:hypothetical protein
VEFDRSVVIATSWSLQPQDPGRIVGQPQRLDKSLSCGVAGQARRQLATSTAVDARRTIGL